MTPPQKKPTQSGCNTVDQREYCEAQMAHMQERAELQLKAIEAAYRKAEIQLDERLAGMNEFRQAMGDQAARFVTREELELKLAVLDKDVRMLQAIASEAKGKASTAQLYISWLFSAGALLLALLALFR
jgi:hypothetical protein